MITTTTTTTTRKRRRRTTTWTIRCTLHTKSVQSWKGHLSWASCHAAPLVQLRRNNSECNLGIIGHSHATRHLRKASKSSPAKSYSSQHYEQAVTRCSISPSFWLDFEQYQFSVDFRKGLVCKASKQRHFSDSNCPFHAVNCFQVRNSRIRFNSVFLQFPTGSSLQLSGSSLDISIILYAAKQREKKI